MVKSFFQAVALFFWVGLFMFIMAYIGSIVQNKSINYQKQKKHKQDSLQHRHDSLLQINRRTNSEYYKF